MSADDQDSPPKTIKFQVEKFPMTPADRADHSVSIEEELKKKVEMMNLKVEVENTADLASTDTADDEAEHVATHVAADVTVDIPADVTADIPADVVSDLEKVLAREEASAKAAVEEKEEVKSPPKVQEPIPAVFTPIAQGKEAPSLGDTLEAGWESRGGRSSLFRNVEVWGFALKSVRRVLKAKKSGDSAEKTEAALFIRDGLLRLGPTFVKLGQVVSTRTDILDPEYIQVLNSLQDDVPGFSGSRAKLIVTKELGRECDEVFQNFSAEPLAAASLGQVHTATYQGQPVAIKVQRAGLKELFDVDLKNLKKLAVLLDKFDPKSDGADREWGAIYDQSALLLYKEIDYFNEAANAKRFQADFQDYEWVKVPKVMYEVSTPRVLTMEYVESFKLTDLAQVDRYKLDRKLLAKRSAEAFLRQIVETGYFHCDPHPGNLCVNKEGQLIFYDFGMMDELKPNVREGFRNFCISLFSGGPFIDDIALASNAKGLVRSLEQMGVLASGADTLATEKLGRFFIRNFKNAQMGKTPEGGNIKSSLGADLQTLTDNKDGTVFRFPSTFTFIFRAFASVDGIGKGLDKDYDLGKLAQPFIEKFTETKKYSSKGQKFLSQFGKATGLNVKDVNTAVTTPRKVAYIEETLREMEQGNLKIRVRSLETETALDRLRLQFDVQTALLFASVLLTAGVAVEAALLSGFLFAGAGGMTLKAIMAVFKVKKFDKKQLKYAPRKFSDDV
eukprot:CAMPEP_0196574902 /NCGR_PEP_ID=MMETSP1081-20130531/4506_1 /TAXON_ID=36882 /ORGANISM="Pyramimonas amylifera, Strain CCMP720" /LENGTH=729 /DNA_ID=CAMNT_0041893047 /DNA_START=269 /DNA_END=2458 /DNA_ORIENTATION=+